MRRSEPAVRRYVIGAPIASGGTATVHYGRLFGSAGFSRTVAVKRLQRQFLSEPELVAMLIDEARLTGRIRHANVASVCDVIHTRDELALVMDYVHGESLARLLRAAHAAGTRPTPEVAVGVLLQVLHGLEAAHGATSEKGQPLGIIHRDVTPQNILVGADGVARLADFGVARAIGRLQTTRGGQLKGKLAYMAPEQLLGKRIDARADLFSAAIVLWETLTARRLFKADSDAAMVQKVLNGVVDRPSRVVPGVPVELDEIVMKGVARDPSRRWQSAREMALALERAASSSSSSQIAHWVMSLAGPVLDERAEAVARMERGRDCTAAPSDIGGTQTVTSSVRRRRWRRSAVAASIATVALGIGFSLGRGSDAAVHQDRRSGPEPEAIPTPPVEIAAEPANVPEAPPSAASSASASVVAQPPPQDKRNRGTSPRRATTQAPRRGCDPPYRVDERGIVQLKRECL
jgi:serine/threonine-protein kinase